MRKQPHQAQRGFLTVAQNSDVNYLELAYLQGLNIKTTQPNSLYAIVVDELTHSQITQDQHRVFDYVITLDIDSASKDTWKLANEWQTFYLTPFKETIKLEADLLFTRSIEHWWRALQLQDVVLSHGVVDYQQKPSTSRRYRKLFDENSLPDVYNGMMYFRYSVFSTKFFQLAQQVFENWDSIRDKALHNVRDDRPTTDAVYAIVCAMMERPCYIPSLDFFKFAHMKPAIQGWADNIDIYKTVYVENNLADLRINNVQQLYPVHYHDKTFKVKELIKEYEQELYN